MCNVYCSCVDDNCLNYNVQRLTMRAVDVTNLLLLLLTCILVGYCRCHLVAGHVFVDSISRRETQLGDSDSASRTFSRANRVSVEQTSEELNDDEENSTLIENCFDYSYYYCVADKTCISKQQLCDNVNNCSDGQDEEYCEETQCTENACSKDECVCSKPTLTS